jgi:hypothetical protein
LLARRWPEACCEWLDCERPGALRELVEREREAFEPFCELELREPCWPDFDEDCFVMSDKLHFLGVQKTAGSRIRVRPMRACVLALWEIHRGRGSATMEYLPWCLVPALALGDPRRAAA